MTTETIPATEIRRGDVITLPSGRTRRIQRAHILGEHVEIIFPDPVDGHAWLRADALVERG